MAARNTPEKVRELALARGKLAARGVTVDFAPVVDVGDQPRTPSSATARSPPTRPSSSRYAGAFADGLRAAGVLPVLKHFPGHGHASGDSHKGRVTTPPLAELRATDLRPYEQLLGTGKVDGDGRAPRRPRAHRRPAHLAHPGDLRLLRDDYRFDGLVVTDDLGAMKAVTGTFTLPEAVLRHSPRARTRRCGLGRPGRHRGRKLLDSLEKALADGRLDPAANDRAVARALEAKGVCG